jgi:hypothetical protein
MLTPTETVVTKALLSGSDPQKSLAAVRGKEKPTVAERDDVRRAMASERVRRAIAGATRVRRSELRAFVLEKLVSEAEDAREGAVRLKAVELIGNLPGVDAWKPAAEGAESLAEAGVALGEVLSALQDRLASEVIDVPAVQDGPNRAQDGGSMQGNHEAKETLGVDGDEGEAAALRQEPEVLDPWA